MVKVRKLGRQVVRSESLLKRLFAPLREAFSSMDQVSDSMSETAVGAYAAHQMMKSASFIMILPVLVIGIPLLLFAVGVVWATHIRLKQTLGEYGTYAVEVVLAGALIARAVIRYRRERREVEPASEEFMLAPEEVEARIASGALRPFDLVHDGAAWNTLSQSALFEFACEEPIARERSRQRWRGFAKFLGWSAFLAVYVRWLVTVPA